MCSNQPTLLAHETLPQNFRSKNNNGCKIAHQQYEQQFIQDGHTFYIEKSFPLRSSFIKTIKNDTVVTEQVFVLRSVQFRVVIAPLVDKSSFEATTHDQVESGNVRRSFGEDYDGQRRCDGFIDEAQDPTVFPRGVTVTQHSAFGFAYQTSLYLVGVLHQCQLAIEVLTSVGGLHVEYLLDHGIVQVIIVHDFDDSEWDVRDELVRDYIIQGT